MSMEGSDRLDQPHFNQADRTIPAPRCPPQNWLPKAGGG